MSEHTLRYQQEFNLELVANELARSNGLTNYQKLYDWNEEFRTLDIYVIPFDSPIPTNTFEDSFFVVRAYLDQYPVVPIQQSYAKSLSVQSGKIKLTPEMMEQIEKGLRLTRTPFSKNYQPR